MLTGSSVYDQEVADILKRLEAKGILLIVIDGNKNASPIEFASALREAAIPCVLEVLALVHASMKADLIKIKEMEVGHG